MLGFILSKLNLLILVTAMFAIIGFFTLGLVDISAVNEAQELASRLNERSFALANSSNFCFSENFRLPQSFSVAGKQFYYVLEISRIGFGDAENRVNSLVFIVYPRDEVKDWYAGRIDTPKSVAADSFRTNAEIRLFNYDYVYNQSEDSMEYSKPLPEDFELLEGESMFLDPQAAGFQLNGIEIKREVVDGQPKLYVVGCPSDLCAADAGRIGGVVNPPNPPETEGGFKC